MSTRQIPPPRRQAITQKIKVGNARTLHISTHDAPEPLEIFVRVKGPDCTAETIALYDILSRLASVALQYGAPLETIGSLLRGVKVEPAGIVTGHPTIHFCSSLPDAIGQHLLSLCGNPPFSEPSYTPSTQE